MSASSVSHPSASQDFRDPSAHTVPVMLASDLDDALRATLYDFLVEEGYHVCAPRKPLDGLALLRTGECGAIMIMSLPPESVTSSDNWLTTLTIAQFTEPLIASRLRKQYALIGLASGTVTNENMSSACSPLWNSLTARWRAILPIPFDLDALMGALTTASNRLHNVA